MEELEALTAYDWTLWIAGLFALLELFRWIYSFKEFFFEKVGIKTKGMLKREEDKNRLKQVEESIKEIKETYKKNVELSIDHERHVVENFMNIKDEILIELTKLHEKIDEQAVTIEKNNNASIKTECAMLRDRLNSGIKYFSQKTDEQGRVHINLGDYEILDSLFQEYFSKGGNGVLERMYEEEFKHFIIDR